MKKNFSRALSLLLVLVMILGAMPMAMATESDPQPTASISLRADKATYVEGETVHMTLTANAPEGYTLTSVNANPAATYSISGNTATASYPAMEGEWNLSATATFTGPEGATLTAADSVSVTVTAAPVEATGLIITSAPASMAAQTQQQLTVVATPDGAELPADLVWSSSAPTVATVSSTGLVKALKQSSTPVTITVSSASTGLSASVNITVTAVAIELTVRTSSLTLAPKEVGTIYWKVTPSTVQEYVTLTMTSANTRVAQVDSNTGRVTAVAAGDTTITVKAALNRTAPDTLKFVNGLTSMSVTVPVTVTDQYYIACSNDSARAGSRITLTPILYDGNGQRVNNATFTYSFTGCSVSTTNNQTFSVTSNTAGSASVTFTANGYTNDNKAVTKTVELGFYKTNTLKVNVRDNISSFRFYDKNIFLSAVGGTQNYTNLTSLSMSDLIGYAMPISGVYGQVDYYSFGVSGSNGGELLAPTSGSSLNWGTGTKYVDSNNVDSVGFQQKSSTNKVSNFTIYAMTGGTTEGVIVGMLTLEINAGASSGGIEYATTYNKAVTFKAADFQNYWNSHKNDNYYGTGSYSNSTLSYVVFGISNTVPAYGTLYTTSAKTTKATAGMKFAPSTTASGSYYALGSVTYVPATNYTATYTVDIPFTAYGTSGDSVSGYVTIKLNESSNVIGARGTTIDTSVAESIAANYYNAKGQTMGYVVFELPSAQQATLYRSIPKSGGYSRVTEATKAVSGDRFYYYTTNYNNYTSGKYNCGCNNAYYCDNTYCIYYDGTSYTTGTVNCGCNNLKYCTNSYCKFYDGPAYNCGCNNAYYCNNSYCIYYDGATNNTNYNTTSNQYSANQMQLTNVSIVPAAGYSGTLTLTYTAYNAGGASPYKGYITYTVETKSTSAVFSDVKGSYSWAADSSDFLYYEGTAQGSNGKYNPSANITRGDFMLMLYRAFLESDYSTTAVTGNFSDVTKGNTTYSQETYQAVGIAKQLGIAQGTNGKFNPKSNITREEAMVLIYRTLNEINRSLRYRSSTNASSFSDYRNISSWATTAISDLVSHGVIQGSNNKITPKSNITRAEMACILHRVITY